ncbi:MAG: hypothetical protein Udaeo_03570 [Candidatus Udaeobacter sp.]|nr:MAG: hypothetical protein Udaeo_03570 [Candidatus Udaeobacter sp.]
MLCKQGDIPRVESFGFIEIGLTSLPFPLPACYVGQQFRNPAAIGKKRTRLLKVTHSRVVVLQTGILVKSLGQYGLAKIGLKS